MKVRESSMPEQNAWESYFDADRILTTLGLRSISGNVVELGCGYGTFTIPTARRVTGTVYALDIDPSMIAIAKSRAEELRLRNIEFSVRDFVSAGTGLADGSADYALIFNILHHEDPVALLQEAFRSLRVGGRAGIIHWNYDPATPRGPPMSIRPHPEQCRAWAEQAGFEPISDTINLPPYHYGLISDRRQ